MGCRFVKRVLGLRGYWGFERDLRGFQQIPQKVCVERGRLESGYVALPGALDICRASGFWALYPENPIPLN